MSYNLTGTTASSTYGRLVQVVHGLPDLYYDGFGNLLDLGLGSASVGPQGYQGGTGPQGPQGWQGPLGYSFIYQGIWDNSTIYYPNDLVTYNNVIYLCINGITGDPPFQTPFENTTNWQPLSYQGPTGPQGFQGNQGSQGRTGPQGFQGFQGVTGPQGFQGNQGFQGVTGPQGIQGLQGNQGFQGSTGSQGIQGTQGFQGPTGSQGIQGPQGNQGYQGPTGSQGIQGNQGVQGLTGPQGFQGLQGYQGPTGPQGFQGNQGFQGVSGPQGTQGTQGASGPQGLQGVTGPQGSDGNQGFQGATGPQGFQGSNGQSTSYFNYKADNTTIPPVSGYISWDNSTHTASNTLYISHITTDNVDIDIFLSLAKLNDYLVIQSESNSIDYQKWIISGTPSTVINSYWAYPVTFISGSYSASVNDKVILAVLSTGNVGPQGPQGIQGEQGFQGATGPQGFQGDIGPQGFKGDQGFQGPTGPQGFQGHQGFQGPTGPQGFQGDQGVQGPTGPQGFQGDQGVQGPTGPQGFQGGQGFQGPTGPQGFQGNQGFQGPTGSQGFQGPQGFQGDQGFQGSSGPQGFQGNQGVQGGTGPQGNQGPIGFSTGKLYYINLSNTQTPYNELSTTPTTYGETFSTNLIAAGSSASIGNFLTPPGDPGITVLPTGRIAFYLHLKADTSDTWDIFVEIYKSDLSSTETLLLTTDTISGSISTASVIMYTTDVINPTNSTLLITDRFLVKIIVQNTSSNSNTIYLHTEGSTNYSFISTPLNTLSGPQGYQGPQGDIGFDGNDGSNSGRWSYQTGLTATGAGYFSADNDTRSSSTIIYVNFYDNYGSFYKTWWNGAEALVLSGKKLYLQETKVGSNSEIGIWEINSIFINNIIGQAEVTLGANLVSNGDFDKLSTISWVFSANGISGIDGSNSGRWQYTSGIPSTGQFNTTATFSFAGSYKIDTTSYLLPDYTSWLYELATLTNGQSLVQITQVSDNSKIGIFYLRIGAGVTASTSVTIEPITILVDGIGTFVENEIYTISWIFAETGAQGPQGPAGEAGSAGGQGDKGGLQYLYSNTTTIADPTTTRFRLNSLTASNVTTMAISGTVWPGTSGTNLGGYLDTWDDSTSTLKGHVLIKSNTNLDNTYLIYQVNSLIDNTSWKQLSLTYVTGTMPSNGERCALEFFRTGDAGQQGPTGPQGFQGDKGSQGFQGPQGSQGETGPQGFQGFQGFQGTTGPQGFQGFQGSTGPQGFQGFQGPTGPQGFQGPTGPQGFEGIQGSTGPQGTQGPTGPFSFNEVQRIAFLKI